MDDELVFRQDEMFLRRSFHRSLVPCILSILSGNINILVDGIIVGQCIGVDGLSAISLCVPVYLVLCVIGSFIVSGAAIQASKAIGSHDDELGQRMYRSAVWLCLASSLLITAIGLPSCRMLSVFLASGDEVLVPLVMDYTWATIFGALPKILIYVPFWFLRLDGRASLVTIMMLVMGGGNAVLDVLFLYPLDMGIAGAAWASVISTAVACLLGFMRLSDKHSSFRMGPGFLKGADEWRGLALDGSPSAMNNLFQTFRLLAVNSLLMLAGGSGLVAVFTAVNCISAFSQAITEGVPQAASPMLGICSGERDSGSILILIRRQWRSGLLCTAAFSIAIIALSRPIAILYGLDASLFVPMIAISLGMVPGLWCSILVSYFNIAGHPLIASTIIFSRVFLVSSASLAALIAFDLNPWWFLLLGELLTIPIWLLIAGIVRRGDPSLSRFLLLDDSLEREGKVISFSVQGTVEDICSASERLSAFCSETGMDSRKSMALSLGVEEIMTLVSSVNEGELIRFDVRMFSLGGSTGLRIRCGGREFDPFSGESHDESYLGIDLISGMAEVVMYQRTFGANSMLMLLKE